MKSILVTGSAGFIGANLVLRLLETSAVIPGLTGNLKIVGLDNLNDYYDPSLKECRLKMIIDKYTAVASSCPAPTTPSCPAPTTPSCPAPTTPSCPAPTGHLPAIDYQFIRGDITDAALLNRLFAEHRFDIVVHLAAQVGARNSLERPYDYVQDNIVGFLNILEACVTVAEPVEATGYQGVKHLIFASSSSVYGLNEKSPFAESDPTDRPVSPYAATKKCDELLAHVYSQTYGLRVTGLRFFTVYGPWGRPDMAPMLFAKAICDGEPINVFNNGDMLRDFTYVDDIVEGIIRVMGETPDQPPVGAEGGVRGDETSRHACHEERHSRLDRESYAIYNIGGAHPVKLTDFIAALEEALGRKAVQRFLPMQPGDVPATCADTSAFERDFGFTPRTPLQEGLRQFAEWYKQYYGI